MSVFTVTTSPQEIYPVSSSLNLATVLTNLGGSTIYLDNNSSISPTLSLSLPPLGSITWDYSSPLFVMTASGQATLQTTINGEAPLYQGNIEKQIYEGMQNTSLNADDFGYLETSAYESLIIYARNPTALNPIAAPYTVIYDISVTGVSIPVTASNIVENRVVKKYSVFAPPSDLPHYVKIVIPVETAYTRVSVTTGGVGTLSQTKLRVFGSTRKMNLSMHGLNDFNGVEPGLTTISGIETYGNNISIADYKPSAILANSFVYLNMQPSETAQITLRHSTAITTRGLLYFANQDNVTTVVDALDIPTTAGAGVAQTIMRLPISTPLVFFCNPALATAGNVSLNIKWL